MARALRRALAEEDDAMAKLGLRGKTVAILTSRNPDDLPAFCGALIEAIAAPAAVREQPRG